MASNTTRHMKRLSWDKQLGLASPLKNAAIQSAQHQTLYEGGRGWMQVTTSTSLSRGREKNFFLDILFHRMSEIGMLVRRAKPARSRECEILTRKE